MSTTTLTKTPRTVLAAGSTVTAGTPNRAAIDVKTGQGGILTAKITNGATGPTAQCVAKVLIAHATTTPAVGAAGADWKTLAVLGGGGTANAVVTEFAYAVDAGVMQIEIEFAGNTGQNVTAECYLSEITDAQTV